MLQASSLALIGMLTVVGCGGSDTTTKQDAGRDTIGTGETNQPLPGKVTVTPSFLDFLTVDVGASSTAQAITVSVSVAAVAISPTIVGAGFALAGNTCAASQAPGTSCTISVKFAPTSVGAANGVLSIGGATVSLSGTGNTPGVFTAPDRIELGTLKQGATAPVTVLIAPQGTVPSLVCTSSSATELAPNAAATTCPATGAVSASCVYAFTFNAATAGSRSPTVTCSGGTKTTITTVAATVVGPPVLAVSQTSALFNAVVNKTDTVVITVSNNGGSPTAAAPAATISAGATDYAVTANDCVVPLAPLATCKVTVTFAPKTAGAKPGTLSVTEGTASLSVTLNGTAVADRNVAITPNPGDFGTVVIGESKALAFTMKNSGGTATGAVTLAGGSGEFVISNDLCTGATLAATNGQCTFTVTFVPAAPASTTAHEAIVTSSDAAGPLANVKVQGIAAAPRVGVKLDIDPPALDFGTTTVGVPVGPKVFTITNSGDTASGTLSVVKNDSTSSVGGAAQFNPTTTCVGSLAPKATCQVAVTYAPTIDGNASATITVTDGTVATKASTVVGTALKKAAFTVKCPTTSAADFTTKTVVGTTSTQIVTCTVANDSTNTQATGALTVAATGDFALAATGNTCTASLSPGSTCAFNLTFKPTAKGLRTGTLTVTGANGGLVTGNITGTGLGVVELVALKGSSCIADGAVNDDCVQAQPFDFGQVSVGATSTTTLTVAVFVRANVGTLVNTLSLGTPAEFVVAGSNSKCATTSTTTPIADADVSVTSPLCYYTVALKPTSKTAKTGSITMTGANAATDTATFGGTGTGPLTISPSPVAFQTVGVGSSAIITLTVTNNSTTTDASAASYTLTGTNAAEFVVISDDVTGNGIAKNTGTPATRQMVVRFVPASAGAKTATITVTAKFGTIDEVATVSLTGTGGAPAQISAAITTAFVATGINGKTTGVVTVTNNGASTSELVYFALANNSDFTVETGATKVGTCGAPGAVQLTAGASCTINVNFQPTSGLGLTTRTDTLGIWAAKGGLISVPVSAAATPELTVTPSTTQDFGAVTSGLDSATNITFTVTNNSAGTVTLTVGMDATNPNDLAGYNSDYFGVVAGSSCVGSAGVASGATCTFQVYMHPDAAAHGVFTGTVKVNDAAHSQTAYANVTGTAQTPAALKFTAATGMDRDFGTVRLGTKSSPAVYTITNTGDQTSGALSWTLMSAATGNTAYTGVSFVFDLTTATVGANPCSTDAGLAGGASCSIGVAFNAVACTGGATSCTDSDGETAYLKINARNAVGAPTTGIVLRTDATLSAIPALHGVPTASANSYHLLSVAGVSPYVFPASATATTATLTLSNNTNSAMTYSALTTAGNIDAVPGVVGLQASSENTFTITSTSCGTSVAAGSSCTFVVTWNASAGAAGNYAALVTVGDATMVLSGHRPTNAVLSVTPATYDFGGVLTSATGITTLTVKNTGDLATGSTPAVAVTGDDAGQVAITGNTCSTAALPAGGTCTIEVTVDPSAGANQTADVEVTATSTTTGSATLTWDGTVAAKLTPSAYNFAFDSTAVGAVSAKTTVTITNATNGKITGALGFATSTTDFVVDAGTASGDCGHTSLAAGLVGGAHCTLYVTFSPKALASPDKSARLLITSANAPTPVITLTGTAKAPLTVSPTGTSDFGSVAVGATDNTPITITVSLDEGVLVTGELTTTLSGTNAGDFRIIADNCTGNSLYTDATSTFYGVANPFGADLETSCTVVVTFAPKSSASATAKTATVTVSGTPGDSVAKNFTGTATAATH